MCVGVKSTPGAQFGATALTDADGRQRSRRCCGTFRTVQRDQKGKERLSPDMTTVTRWKMLPINKHWSQEVTAQTHKASK